MRIFDFIERARLNREQRHLLSDVARLAVQYSDGEGESAQNPIIISNADSTLREQRPNSRGSFGASELWVSIGAFGLMEALAGMSGKSIAS